MHCPHCQTSYHFASGCEKSEFVCWCCHHPLSTDQASIASDPEQHIRTTAPLIAAKEASMGSRILMIMALLMASGFLLQYDAWLSNSWLRSQLLSWGVPIQLRQNDWNIDKASIQSRWLTRQQGQKVLLIHCRLENTLSVALQLPLFQVSFFAQGKQAIGSTTLHTIVAPADSDIQTGSYLNPAWDLSSLPGLSQKNITLLIQHLPEQTIDFTVQPVVTPPASY